MHTHRASRTACKERDDMEMPGIEPGASRMQSERSTTELHPHLLTAPPSDGPRRPSTPLLFHFSHPQLTAFLLLLLSSTHPPIHPPLYPKHLRDRTEKHWQILSSWLRISATMLREAMTMAHANAVSWDAIGVQLYWEAGWTRGREGRGGVEGD